MNVNKSADNIRFNLECVGESLRRILTDISNKIDSLEKEIKEIKLQTKDDGK